MKSFSGGGNGSGRGQGGGGRGGRGRGGQQGGGQGNRAGQNSGSQAGAPAECVCPNCGHHEEHKRGVPCNGIKCPECGNTMVRA